MIEDNGSSVVEMGSTGGALVAQGFQLMRIENDSMLQVAIQRPREEDKIIKAALAELDLVPEQAKAAYYEIPFRDGQDDGSVKIAKVSGPSIKAAMSLVRRWGNCSVSCRLMNEDLEGFNLDGIYLDLESNYRLSRPMRVLKTYKNRSKKIIALDPKRLEMAIQAGASKAIRNVTLAGLPAYLVGAYDQKAREITGGKLDAKADPKTVQAVLRAFGKMKVSQEMLEKYAELPMDEWTGNEVASLRGIWNALQDGQMTIEEAFDLVLIDGIYQFGSESLKSPTTSVASVTVTPDSLLGAEVTGENDSNPHTEVPPQQEIHTTPTPEAIGHDATTQPQAPPQWAVAESEVMRLLTYADTYGLLDTFTATMKRWPDGITQSAFDGLERNMKGRVEKEGRHPVAGGDGTQPTRVQEL